jgi:DNA-binding transcriptional LysR family regulator
MDRLHAMHVFVTVADLRGFAPAARRLQLSPSAVTRQLAALEEHLGARLLQRTTRSVALTDAGTRFLARARTILADVAEAEGAAQAERTAPRGRLVLSAPLVFGRMHVAPLLCAYLARYPDVSAELVLSDHVVSLVDDGVDAAVRIGVLDDASFVARSVGETRRVLVASPRYFEERKRPRGPADLAHHATILLTSLTPSPEWHFEGDRRVAITPRLATNSADAAIGHALLGGGIAMVLSYQVADAVREGRLEVLLAEHEPAPLPIHVVYPSTRLLSAKVRAFVDLAKETTDWRFSLASRPRARSVAGRRAGRR